METRDDSARYARVWQEAMAMARRAGVRDRALREDVAQEAMVRAWRSGREERWWLRAVVRHCAIDARRAQARVQYGVELDAREGPCATAMSEARADARRAVRAVVARAARLTPSLREVWDAVVREGRAIDEVARALGVSRAVVDTRLRRMRMRLRGE